MVIKRIVVGSLFSNCYVISNKSKNAFIIDPGDDPHLIKEYINENKLKVNFIINTHYHVDHISAAYELGFPVYMHKLDASAMEEIELNLSVSVLGKFKPCKVERLLSDGDVIKFDDLDIQILHTPGHTPGGISVKLDHVVFTGDTLFKDGVGRTDFPDGSYEKINYSIRNKLLCLDNDFRVYPGHGEPTTIGREKNNF